MGISLFNNLLLNINYTDTWNKKEWFKYSLSEQDEIRIYIDLNSIIYDIRAEIIKHIYKYLESSTEDRRKISKLQISPNPTDSNDDISFFYENINYDNELKKENKQRLHKIFMDIMIYYIESFFVVTFFNKLPNDKIFYYIVLDGIPSVSKMIEQRRRKYIESLEIKFKKILLPGYKNVNKIFDKLNISPRTIFMTKLETQLGIFFSNPNLNLNYEINGTNSKNEGEQKIFQNIKIDCNENTITYIFSKDSDVNILSLINNSSKETYVCELKDYNNIFNFDNQVNEGNSFRLIDIRIFKDKLIDYVLSIQNENLIFKDNNEYEQFEGEEDTDYDTNNINNQKIINDIVFLFFIFGNDYIPNIESLNLEFDIFIILRVYSEIIKIRNIEEFNLIEKMYNDRYELNIRNFTYLLIVLNEKFPENQMLYKSNFERKNIFSPSFKSQHIQYLKSNDLSSIINHLGENEYKTKSNFGFQKLKPKEETVTSSSSSGPKTSSSSPGPKTYNKYPRKGKGPFNRYQKQNQKPNPKKPNQNQNQKQKGGRIYSQIQPSSSKQGNKGNIPVFAQKITSRNYIRSYNNDGSKTDSQHLDEIVDNLINEGKYRIQEYLYDDNRIDFTSNQSIDELKRKYRIYYFGLDLENDMNEVVTSYISGLYMVFQNYFNQDYDFYNFWFYKYQKAPLLRNILKHKKLFLNNDEKKCSININIFEGINYQQDNFEFDYISRLLFTIPNLDFYDIENIFSQQELNLIYEKYSKLRNFNINEQNFYYSEENQIDDINNRNFVDCYGADLFSMCYVNYLSTSKLTTASMFLNVYNEADEADEDNDSEAIGGAKNNFYLKYLKYKNKYLNLKNKSINL